MFPKSNSYAVTLNDIVTFTGNKKETKLYFKSHGGIAKGYKWFFSFKSNVGDTLK